MVTVSRDRFNLVKIGYRQGDRPALDTTEALAQLQQFEFMQSEALVNLQVSGLELSNFLWAEGDRFYQLDSTIVPDMLWQTNVNNDMTPLADLLAQATVSHPALAMYEQKLQALRIERKLKFQDLLPKIDLSANLLNKGYNVFNKIGGNFYENNNKFGISLGLPLRLSEGRGGYKLAGLKLKETGLEMEMKRQSVVNKLSAYFQEMTGLQKQVDIYGLATDNFEKLARGENLRFRAGEGTLFLVNSRENKLLEARQKLIELKTKWQKSKLAVQWAAGVLK
jgi:outer membrane protein TolC